MPCGQDVLGDEDYFMTVAMTTAQRSRDPYLQVGACIVDAYGRVCSVGYNNMPKGDDTCNRYSWKRCPNDESMFDKKLYVCHAEENAIVGHPGNYRGCRLYVTTHPCNQCAKLIVLCGIREVVYKDSHKHSQRKYRAARIILDQAGVELRQYTPLAGEVKSKL